MTPAAAPTMWPFVIVQSRLIVTPDFLARLGENDARIRRLLLNQAQIDQSRGSGIHHRVMNVPNVGSFALAYRYVPVPGGGRDEATRLLHMAEGVICNDPHTNLTDAALDRSREHVLGAVRRYVEEGWSGPPEQSHGTPLSAYAPVDYEGQRTAGRQALIRRLVVAFLASAGGIILLLIIKRFVNWNLE